MNNGNGIRAVERSDEQREKKTFHPIAASICMKKSERIFFTL